jgi:hypothetical protein
MNKTKNIIFYSWQSDLPKDTNQNGIRSSLKSAIPLVEDLFDNIDLQHDEATRNVSGSPDITKEIFSKISSSDIFICDLTPIAENENKKIANPNVLIELGYAVSEIGWERIIVLFNLRFGKIPDDLPFDVAKHRITPFKIIDKTDKNGKSQLTQVLKEALKMIIENNPLKPHLKKYIDPELKKRKLDVDSLNKLLSSIHIETFDYFLYEAPSLIIGEIFYYQESFNSVYNASSFHIYDEKLFNLIKEFQKNLNEVLSYGHNYLPTQIVNRYKFQLPDYNSNPENFEKVYGELNYLSNLVDTLSKDFKNLLIYIRINYLEIDLVETSNVAYNEYLKFKSS